MEAILCNFILYSFEPKSLEKQFLIPLYFVLPSSVRRGRVRSTGYIRGCRSFDESAHDVECIDGGLAGKGGGILQPRQFDHQTVGLVGKTVDGVNRHRYFFLRRISIESGAQRAVD